MPRESAASAAVARIAPMRMSPPAELGEAEAAIFRQTIASVPSDHFRGEDLVLLAAYSRTAIIERRAAEALAGADPPSKDQLAAWRESSKILLALSVRLRIGPRSRDNHPRPRTPQAVASYYETMNLEGVADVEN